MRTIVLFTFAALLLASCAPQQPDMTALRKTVDAFNAAVKEGMLSSTSDKAMAFYATDAVEFAPNMAMAKGKAAIQAMEDQMNKSAMKITAAEFTLMDLQAGGTVAYETGTYEMTVNVPPMGDVKDKGKYITLWRQQKDGSWKVSGEMWNSDNPPPSMEQPKKKK